jgi:hypothetical protein
MNQKIRTVNRSEVRRYDYMDAIIRFENGELGREETVELFQYLVDTGLAWSLQGSYGRTAARLIEDGIITDESRKVPTHDA